MPADTDVPTEGCRATAPVPSEDWTPTAGSPGWSFRTLLESPGFSTRLMRVEPGTISLPHAHDRLEQVYILSGSLSDADGTTYGPGTFIARSPGAIHGGVSNDGATMLVVYGDID